MKPISLILTALFFFIHSHATDVFAQEPRADTAAALEAIHSVVEAYETTWNANDISAWGALFTDDVDYVNRGGGRWTSNEDNIEGHRRIHERLVADNQPMNLQLTVDDVAFLSPSIALVHVTSRWPGLRLPGRQEGEPGAIMTMVMVENEGRWLIRAFHNTLITNPNP